MEAQVIMPAQCLTHRATSSSPGIAFQKILQLDLGSSVHLQPTGHALL